jgi:hypothetical protein
LLTSKNCEEGEIKNLKSKIPNQKSFLACGLWLGACSL